jgi:ribosomal protein S12 methylthiotransferase accessory factor YcaO
MLCMKTAKTQNSTAELRALVSALADQFDVRELNGQDHPIFLAVAFPRREGITGLKPRLPAGRGFTKAQAVYSAAAEAAELLCSLATQNTKANHPIIDIDGVDSVTVNDMATGANRSVEAQSVFLDYAMVFEQTLTIDANSNGCACGENIEDAKARGLLECVERDALAIWWYGRQSRSHLSLAFIDQAQPRLSYWLTRRARSTMAIDITSDLGVPVVVAVSSERDGTHVAMGSAANLDIETAAIHAISEMIQIEVSMRLSAQADNPELQDWLKNASTLRMPQFRADEQAETLPSQLQKNVLQCVTDAGFYPLSIDLTQPQLPVACARVLVPGLSGMRTHKNEGRILSLSKNSSATSTRAVLESFDPY